MTSKHTVKYDPTDKWIKVGIEYLRTNGDHGTTNNLLYCKKINRENIDTALKDYFLTWTSEGSVKILNIITGPYVGDQISESDEGYFIDRVYPFDN